MALDPSIALGVKQVEIADPLAQYAKMSAIQSAQTQNALAQYQLGAAQRAEADTESIRNALKGVKYGTPEYETAVTNAMLGTGNVKGLQEYQKGKSEAAKAEAELKIKQDEIHRANLGNLAMNPSNENILAHLQDGIIKGEITQAQAASQWQALGPMNPKQRVDFFNTAAQTADQRVGHEISRGQLGVAQGQLKVAQDRLAQDAQAVTYQTDANGNIVAVPTKIAPGTVAKATPVIAPGPGMEPLKAKDASKTAVSEQQAAYNVGRILSAAKEINKIVKEDPSAIQPGAAEAGFTSLGMKGTANATRNANRQIVSGAQRDALDAMLYLATGAAYNKEQLEGQMEAYIPQYTDKPERVASKQVMMRELINNAKIRAGKAWTPEMEAAVQSLTNPASAAGGGVDTSNPLLGGKP